MDEFRRVLTHEVMQWHTEPTIDGFVPLKHIGEDIITVIVDTDDLDHHHDIHLVVHALLELRKTRTKFCNQEVLVKTANGSITFRVSEFDPHQRSVPDARRRRGKSRT